MMLCHVYLYFYGSLTSEGLTFNVSSPFKHRYSEYRSGDLSFFVGKISSWNHLWIHILYDVALEHFHICIASVTIPILKQYFKLIQLCIRYIIFS